MTIPANTDSLAFHPIAAPWPLMKGQAFDALVANIRENGLLDSVTLFEGMILDGRNRYRACRPAGVTPSFVEYRGNDPEGFSDSANGARRHLSESQRAMVAAKKATMERGDNQHRPIGLCSQAEAAAKLNVSERSLKRARVVVDHGSPDLIDAVEQDEIAIARAAILARQSHEFQSAVIAKMRAEEIRPQEAMRRVKAEMIEQGRLAAPTGKYRVIYADPPWSYGNTQQDEFGEQRDHFPVMELDDICALEIEAIAEDNAVLFLWVTSPMLKDCFDVIDAWGFEYKASFVWDKVKHVMGHYNSVRHELLLVCTRGSCQPDVRTLIDSVQVIERTAEHSEKPAEFRQIIDMIYPHGARIELFARTSHPGWAVWGYEAPHVAA